MPIHDWSRVYSGLFHHFHQGWSVSICNALNGGRLPKGVTALVEHKAGPVEADVLAVEAWPGSGSRPFVDPGNTATLARPATRVVGKSDNQVYAAKANRIVVQQPLGRTIAVIEIVSPGNKDGKRAFKQFVEKSQAFINRNIHLLVVDLFPPTKRDPNGVHQAIWGEFDEDEIYQFPEGKDRTLVSYEAGDDRKAAYVEALAVGDAMPEMPLFLDEEFSVMVPLEATYETTWSYLPENIRDIVVTGIMPQPPDGD